MRSETARTDNRTRVNVIAAFASLAAMALLVMSASSAAFTDTDQNEGNFFNADTIELTADGTADVMFEVNDMAPNQVEERCIAVQYTAANLDADVAVYSDGTATDDGLAEFISWEVDVVDANTTDTTPANFDCTGIDFTGATSVFNSELDGFLAVNDFGSASNVAFDSGVDVPSDVKFYRFTATLDGGAGGDIADAAGASVEDITIVWEAQSN